MLYVIEKMFCHPTGSCWQSRLESGLNADADEFNPDLVEDVSLPPDLPLEMIAEEVKNSWRLKVCLSLLLALS